MSTQAKSYSLPLRSKWVPVTIVSLLNSFTWLIVNRWKAGGARLVVKSTFQANYKANVLLTVVRKQADVEKITEIFLITQYWRQAALQKEMHKQMYESRFVVGTGKKKKTSGA